MNSGFVIVRQQAGPFVKAYATDRIGFVQWNRGDSPETARKRCGPAMARTTLDKLELRLALFGYDGVFYTLTFVPDKNPGSWAETKSRWDAFLKKLKRYRAKKRTGKTDVNCRNGFDYVYRIERLHTKGEWHVHCFLRKSDFPTDVVRHLWDWGESHFKIWDYRRVHNEGGYRGLAEYFTKEVPDVGKHPWGASRSLSRQIPEPRITFSRNGQIPVPQNWVPLHVKDPGPVPWGVFQFSRYLTS